MNAHYFIRVLSLEVVARLRLGYLPYIEEKESRLIKKICSNSDYEERIEIAFNPLAIESVWYVIKQDLGFNVVVESFCIYHSLRGLDAVAEFIDPSILDSLDNIDWCKLLEDVLANRQALLDENRETLEGDY
jgi:hypothetical protein